MTPAEPPATSRDLADYENAYAENTFEVVQAGLRKRVLIQLLERHRPRRVLEVGCGTDTLARRWPHAESFVVVEPAANFAAKARADTRGRPDVRVVEGLLEAVAPQLQGGFDVILLSGLLNELVDCDALLGTVRGLCGARTLVHINVANARSFHRLLALEMGLIDDVMGLSPLQKRLQQHRIFSPESLEAYVVEQRFEVAERGDYFIKPFTHAQMQQLRKSGFLSDAMLEGLWGLAKHMPGLGSEIYVNVRLRA